MTLQEFVKSNEQARRALSNLHDAYSMHRTSDFKMADVMVDLAIRELKGVGKKMLKLKKDIANKENSGTDPLKYKKGGA